MTEYLPPLLPCPFCGGDARNDAHADDCYFILHKAMVNAPNADLSMVPDVLKAWNRRAAIAQAQSCVPAGWFITQSTASSVKHWPITEQQAMVLAASPQPQPVQPTTEAATLAIDALEAAKNGLDWYRGVCPQHVAGDDDEMDQQIEAAIAAIQSAQAKPEQAAQPVPLTGAQIDPMYVARGKMKTVGEKDSYFWYAWGIEDAENHHGIAAPQPKD